MGDKGEQHHIVFQNASDAIRAFETKASLLQVFQMPITY
jgi:hypothetical protein